MFNCKFVQNKLSYFTHLSLLSRLSVSILSYVKKFDTVQDTVL